MSMTVRYVYTCTNCNKEETINGDDSGGLFYGSSNAPTGWLTVSGLGPVFTSSDSPAQYEKKRPHLCSWACLAAYAKGISESDFIRK
jgi:hypothetical protein